MPGEPDTLPRSEIGKNLPARFIQPFLEKLDFLLEADVHRMRFRMFAEFIQLVLQFDNRLLEIELVFHAQARLNVFCPAINANSRDAKGRTFVRPPQR
jgi:hypothetical protein